MIDQILERWPDAKYKIKEGELVEWILEEGDFPQFAIRNKTEYEEIIAQINEARAQQAEDERMAIRADTVSKLQKASEEGSPAKQLEGAV